MQPILEEPGTDGLGTDCKKIVLLREPNRKQNQNRDFHMKTGTVFFHGSQRSFSFFFSFSLFSNISLNGQNNKTTEYRVSLFFFIQNILDYEDVLCMANKLCSHLIVF